MFVKHFLPLGIVALSAVIPSNAAAQREAVASEVTSQPARVAVARDAVVSDRIKIRHLEDLIAAQRNAMTSGWGFPLGPDYWDRMFTLGGPPRVLAELEVQLAGAYRKFSRDQGRLDSLERYATR